MFYLDSEGDPELHLRINDHLGMCPECAEWFTRQQRLDQALGERLRAGQATGDLWKRALTRAGVLAPARGLRLRLLAAAALAVAVAVGGIIIALQTLWRSPPPELGRLAAHRHEQLLRGDLRPEVVSSSDKVVEDHLRKQVSFPVHCPPRKDAHFDLKGAGVCRVKGKQAAYIVGEVNRKPVSIFVLNRDSLEAFPHERDHLRGGGGRYRCREGAFEMVSGLTRDNLVIVIGTVSPQALERLLNAYGSYHEEA
jgi:anti-sigma factor RsiW